MQPASPFVFDTEHNENRQGVVLAGVDLAFQGYPELRVSAMEPSHFPELRQKHSMFSTDWHNRHPWIAIWRRSNLSFGTQAFVLSSVEDGQIGMAMQLRLSAGINRVAATHMERLHNEFPAGAAEVINAVFTVATVARTVFNPPYPIEVGVNHPANQRLLEHYSGFSDRFGSTPKYDTRTGLLTLTTV